jgi:pilus assembly protein CpaE
MLKVLLIDDEPIYNKMLQPIMERNQYELAYARSGSEGLVTVASFKPDVIILDVRMPDLSGFDLMLRLRSDPRYASIPVMFVTGQNQLDDKLKAFELGADDYMEKPFSPEELVARVGILLRRSKNAAAQEVKTQDDYANTCTMIAVHSLRGGVGCSSVAVNLAVALYDLWGLPTLLVDTVLSAGQDAMMLDLTPRTSWENFYHIPPTNIDEELVEQMYTPYKTGLRMVAAPKNSLDPELFSEDFWRVTFWKFREQNKFVVFDTPHDFAGSTLQVLDNASKILLLITPEMAALRGAVCAFDIYSKLGYPDDKIKLVLNNVTNLPGIKPAQIEKVLKRSIDMQLPNDSAEAYRALNFGEPFVLKNPESPLSARIEDLAYELSQDSQKNATPAVPSPTWKRVQSRLTGKRT